MAPCHPLCLDRVRWDPWVASCHPQCPCRVHWDIPLRGLGGVLGCNWCLPYSMRMRLGALWCLRVLGAVVGVGRGQSWLSCALPMGAHSGVWRGGLLRNTGN